MNLHVHTVCTVCTQCVHTVTNCVTHVVHVVVTDIFPTTTAVHTIIIILFRCVFLRVHGCCTQCVSCVTQFVTVCTHCAHTCRHPCCVLTQLLHNCYTTVYYYCLDVRFYSCTNVAHSVPRVCTRVHTHNTTSCDNIFTDIVSPFSSTTRFTFQSG